MTDDTAIEENSRIHRPSARSYVTSHTSVPTITQSTALWQAMRHRDELEKRSAQADEKFRASGLGAKLRILLGKLLPFRRKHI